MNFLGYFEKIKGKLEEIENLNDLTVWRKRRNICQFGLTFKTARGFLIKHSYQGSKGEFSADNKERNVTNFLESDG